MKGSRIPVVADRKRWHRPPYLSSPPDQSSCALLAKLHKGRDELPGLWTEISTQARAFEVARAAVVYPDLAGAADPETQTCWQREFEWSLALMPRTC